MTSSDCSDARAQVSQTAAYADSRGMMVPLMVARLSRAANPAPAMLPPMARSVMYSPTEIPVDSGLTRSVSPRGEQIVRRSTGEEALDHDEAIRFRGFRAWACRARLGRQ
jgi:hypothetical protein